MQTTVFICHILLVFLLLCIFHHHFNITEQRTYITEALVDTHTLIRMHSTSTKFITWFLCDYIRSVCDKHNLPESFTHTIFVSIKRKYATDSHSETIKIFHFPADCVSVYERASERRVKQARERKSMCVFIGTELCLRGNAWQMIYTFLLSSIQFVCSADTNSPRISVSLQPVGISDATRWETLPKACQTA